MPPGLPSPTPPLTAFAEAFRLRRRRVTDATAILDWTFFNTPEARAELDAAKAELADTGVDDPHLARVAQQQHRRDQHT